MEKIDLAIQGMHCGGCATGIQMVTEQLDGVTSAFVDLDGKKGTWEVDPSKVTAQNIIDEITKLGYSAAVA
jgi:copper chaperone CopZ